LLFSPRYLSSALAFELSSAKLNLPFGDAAIRSAMPKDVMRFRAEDSWQDSA